MQFSATDMDAILATVGEDVKILLGGVPVKIIQGKFRKNYESISPYESNVGVLHPAVMVKTSDLAGVTNDAVFEIQGRQYKFYGKPEERPDGFSLVHLAAK